MEREDSINTLTVRPHESDGIKPLENIHWAGIIQLSLEESERNMPLKDFMKKNNLKEMMDGPLSFARTFHTTIKKKIQTKQDIIFKCSYCPKKMNSAAMLQHHENECLPTRPYRCDLCTKRFKNSAGRQQHARTHSNEKPYVCLYCNKHFKQKTHLDQHQRTHSGMKPYLCRFCGCQFGQKSTLLSHASTHLSQEASPSDQQEPVQGQVDLPSLLPSIEFSAGTTLLQPTPTPQSHEQKNQLSATTGFIQMQQHSIYQQNNSTSQFLAVNHAVHHNVYQNNNPQFEQSATQTTDNGMGMLDFFSH